MPEILTKTPAAAKAEITFLEELAAGDWSAVLNGELYTVAERWRDGRGVALVMPDSDWQKSYTVDRVNGRAVCCSCPDHKYRGGRVCKHMRLVNEIAARW